jgi:glycosyltransferase involved in cell wall biosynthesis
MAGCSVQDVYQRRRASQISGDNGEYPKPFDVDVVIPVRDGEAYLVDCLDSVIAQSRKARAIIVVDDGSTDSTLKILTDYALRCPALEIVRGTGSGVSRARNLGLARCRAPFVAFLDADDIWDTEKLDRQMQLFSSGSSRLGFVHCGAYFMDEQGKRLPNGAIPAVKHTDLLRALLLEGCVVSGSASSVIARRELCERVGGFDPRLWHGEDWDLWIKLADISELEFVVDQLVGIRCHGNSATRRPSPNREIEFFFQQLVVVDRWYQRGEWSREMIETYRLLASRLFRESRLSLPHIASQVRFFLRLRKSDTHIARELFPSLVGFFLYIVGPRIHEGRVNPSRRRLRRRAFLYSFRAFLYSFRTFLHSLTIMKGFEAWRARRQCGYAPEAIASILRPGRFDSAWYLETYPDVAACRSGPFDHYLKFGAAEGRQPCPGKDFDLIRASGHFDAAWYLAINQDVSAARVDPLMHYVRHGELEGRRPRPDFDPRSYLVRYPYLCFTRTNLFAHSLRHGSPL